MRVCTIVAQNYLAHARVLARSLAEHHGDGKLVVLAFDGTSHVRRDEPFTLVTPGELSLSAAEFRTMATIYSPVELATALKPWLIWRLLEVGARTVLYLDPDVRLYAPLDGVEELIEEYGLVLTPHATQPLPRDGKHPDEGDKLRSGTFNLGFLGVGAGQDGFLDWLSERLRRDCIVAPSEGLYVDQKWMDFAPSYFYPFFLREPEFNVAYWNLHYRSIERSGAGYTVNDRPLRFFHFSGFDPRTPGTLTCHRYPGPLRIELSAYSAVADLVADYAKSLHNADYAEAIALRYGFASAPGGVELDRRMRRLYRAAVIAAEDQASPPPPDPLDPSSAGAFVEWLREPAPRQVAVSRYLQAVFDERRDPNFDLVEENVSRFLRWVREHGPSDASIPSCLVPDAAESAAEVVEVSLASHDEALWAAFVDRPRPGTTLPPWFEILGWVVGRRAPADSVEILRGDEIVARASVAVSRPDVAAAYPEIDGAAASGFRVFLQVSASDDRNYAVRAVLRDGARVPMAVIRLRELASDEVGGEGDQSR